MRETDVQGRSTTAAVTALLLVQVCLGYEWLASGLTKIAHGDFPGGLPSTLAHMGKQAPGWYRGLLTNAIEPHAVVVGYGIEITEVLVGGVLIGAGIVWLVRGPSLSARRQQTLQLAIGAASVVAIVLLANFELANGAGFGMRLGADSFDEGIDLDTVMIGLQIALIVFAVRALPLGSRSSRAVSEPASGTVSYFTSRL